MATTTCTIVDGVEICTIVTAPSCIPGLIWKGPVPGGACACPDDGVLAGIVDGRAICSIPLTPAQPPAATMCTAKIVAPVADPNAATLVTEGCDAASLELALAVILARLLGAR